MAKSRLSPDYIEWVLKLNADQAAREMHKITEQKKELTRQQEAARQAMAKLILSYSAAIAAILPSSAKGG